MKNPAKQILLDILKARPKSYDDFLNLKKKFSGEHGLPPVTNATLIKAWSQLPASMRNRQPGCRLLGWLTKRKTRTLSGVTPITVLTKPFACPGQCLYCPAEPGMPKSYLSNEPAAQRAKINKFDPARQVTMRIRALEANGHVVDKIELLILGGCYNAYTKKYQEQFIKKCFDVCNQRTSKNLDDAFKKNETAKYRIIGVTIETRPDLIDEEQVKWFRELGVTRVQLGVQHLDDKILKLVKRGHATKQTIEATKFLKQAGFKIDYHIMPDLPSSTPQKDLKMFKQLFSDKNFQPDQLKIYPTVVNEFAPLHRWLTSGKYKPYSEKKLWHLLLKMKLAVPCYVRINRLIRDIPKESIMAGNKITNLREFLQAELRKKNTKCKCIRCREARENLDDLKKAKLFTEKYRASDGLEYFISYESKNRDKLYSFIRLRINDDADNFLPELKGAAIVRELHTYGQLMPTNPRSRQPSCRLPKTAAQHTGLGKRLMKTAEELAKKHGLVKIAVIAGIGVRPYYKKLGYGLQGTYMVKPLTTIK
ncbi:tRNA uridine(34) 5-carboxymethylaminomethyl modification radical SAM/GNAT enzyme Elp3 [Patescibacteria group bacterium]|nr:tRNA uridine(34) 5-carboxymethylaminomethyl modification radical SAM/GNAT enzyme Elp3 [Patescibacteria group bacterium]